MDNSDIKYIKAELESSLVYHLRPHFLMIDIVEDCFHIIISQPSFRNQPIPERISDIFNLLKIHHTDILNKYPIVVQCFSAEEMNNVLEYIL